MEDNAQASSTEEQIFESFFNKVEDDPNLSTELLDGLRELYEFEDFDDFSTVMESILKATDLDGDNDAYL